MTPRHASALRCVRCKVIFLSVVDGYLAAAHRCVPQSAPAPKPKGRPS